MSTKTAKLFCSSAVVLLGFLHSARAEKPPCAGNACSDISVGRAANLLTDKRADQSKRRNGASNAAMLSSGESVSGLKIPTIATQFGNHGTQTITIAVNVASNVAVGHPAMCGSLTTFQLTPGATYTVAGLVCSPYQVNYVTQLK